MRHVVLNSGQKMPIIGLGTWRMTGDECVQAVRNSLQLGYRHIDTADLYSNHRDVAAGLAASGVERQDLFITSKVSREVLHYDRLLRTLERILEELNLDYLDLLLIHWPNRNIPIEETLRAMNELKEKGMIKNAGVSNFTISHIEEAARHFPQLISVNQVEFHPYLYQKDLLDYCQKQNIVLTAYSPLARGEIFSDATITGLGEKYGFSPAQLVLRWLVDKGIVVIPKSKTPQYLKDNLDIFSGDIPRAALEKLDRLNEDRRIINPDFAEFDR